jgi:hypothetical protein
MLGARRQAVLGGDDFRDEYSLEFDGTDDYINLGNTFNFGTGDFTISIWAKCADWGLRHHYLLSKNETSEDRWYLRVKNDNPPRLQLYLRAGDAEVPSFYGNNSVGPSFDDLHGQWVHLCISSDRDGKNRGYINSILNDDTDDGSATDVTNTGDLHIANYSGSEFVGSISEVTIYNKALSESEVKTIYNGREPYNHKEGIASSNLQGWWRMGDGVLDRYIASGGQNPTGIISDESVNTYIDTSINALGDNPTMETNDHWTNSNSPTQAVQSDDRAYQGTYSWKVAHNGTTLRGIVNNGVTVTAGKTYYVSARIWCVKGKAKLELGNSHWHDDDAHFVTSKTGEWELLEGFALCDTSTTAGNIYFRTATTADTEFYVDDVKVHPVNGKPGIMINMDANDFVGDTP